MGLVEINAVNPISVPTSDYEVHWLHVVSGQQVGHQGSRHTFFFQKYLSTIKRCIMSL